MQSNYYKAYMPEAFAELKDWNPDDTHVLAQAPVLAREKNRISRKIEKF